MPATTSFCISILSRLLPFSSPLVSHCMASFTCNKPSPLALSTFSYAKDIKWPSAAATLLLLLPLLRVRLPISPQSIYSLHLGERLPHLSHVPGAFLWTLLLHTSLCAPTSYGTARLFFIATLSNAREALRAKLRRICLTLLRDGKATQLSLPRLISGMKQTWAPQRHISPLAISPCRSRFPKRANAPLAASRAAPAAFLH